LAVEVASDQAETGLGEALEVLRDLVDRADAGGALGRAPPTVIRDEKDGRADQNPEIGEDSIETLVLLRDLQNVQL
jgi:hypothetical protein